MNHRGPDDRGILTDGPLGLVFRRLSIIDLSAAANQPMANEDGSVHLVFNGEVYNYRELRPDLERAGHVFRSQADSEVILHAYEEYGESCIDRFNGMFAIAIWDARRRRLFLARDRLGVKPLYYVADGRRFMFSSEIKALLTDGSVPRRANAPAIAQYLQLSYSVDDETWFEGIRKLMPGSTLTVAEGSEPRVRRYWDPIDRYRAPEPAADYPERIRALLRDSVRLRLRSDVPLGAHLSGGLDSSSVVAMMSELSETPVHTFSGAFAEGGDYDERSFIQQVVRQFHTEHHEVVPSAQQLPELLPKLIWHMDEPSAGPGLFPQFMVCLLSAQNGVKVVNGGQGGDELFGGYPKYLRRYASRVARGGAHNDEGSLLGLASQIPTLVSQVWAPRRLKSVIGRTITNAGAPYHRDFSRRIDGRHPAVPRVLDDPLANEMYVDLRYYLPALLQVEDRTSMAVSIESRTPFLDYRLVELAATIPIDQKIVAGELKHQLRSAMRSLLPPGITSRRDKRGFPTPINPWFRTELGGWIRSVVLDSDFQAIRVFSRQYLSGLVRAHRSGILDTSGRLWAAANVAVWFKEFRVTPSW